MANFINKYLNQSAYDADSTKQYPNTSLVGNDVIYTATQPSVDDSNVTYVVNAPSAMTTKIFGYDGSVASEPSTIVDYIKVDGESVNLTTLYSNDNDYQLTQGQHTIKYKFKETSNAYDITGMLGVFRDTNDNSIATSIVCEEGLGAIYGDSAQLDATTIDLPNSVNGIYMDDTIGVGCINLYLRKTSATPELATNCVETVCVDCTEYDPEDPETCIDCAEEECTSSEDVYPIYTNLYVPSAMVSTYTIAGWSNVSAIS